MALPNNITHVFQIPLDWLRAVDAACFKTAPGTLLQKRELPDGGWCFDVDTDALADFTVSATAGAYPSMADFNSLSTTVEGLSVLDPATIAAIQHLVDTIGAGNILTTADIGVSVSGVGHTHLHTDITDWATATQTFLDVANLTSVGDTVGLQYSGQSTVCGPNHGHLVSDLVDLDTQTELVTIEDAQTVTGQKRFSSLVLHGPNGDYVGTSANGDMVVRGIADIVLFCPANMAVLSNAPTVSAGDTVSKAIATCGWVNDTIPVSSVASTIAFPTSIQYDSGTGALGLVTYEFEYDGGILQNVSNPSSSTITTLPPQSSVTTSTSIPIVTGVTWNGTTLQFKSRAATITRGVITALGNESTTTIDTPVTYNAS